MMGKHSVLILLLGFFVRANQISATSGRNNQNSRGNNGHSGNGRNGGPGHIPPGHANPGGHGHIPPGFSQHGNVPGGPGHIPPGHALNGNKPGGFGHNPPGHAHNANTPVNPWRIPPGHAQHGNIPGSHGGHGQSFNQRPQQHALNGHNQHRNPHFYYHPPSGHRRPGQGGSNTPSPPTTQTANSQYVSTPKVELPRSLEQFEQIYNKWWMSFHDDLTKCGTQYGASSLFRVIGGRISSIKSWPWMVSMYSTLINQPWCAGTLIAEDWVVTAAHCFDFVFSDTTTWTLHFGKQNASGSAEYDIEQVRTISQLTVHPDYQPEAEKFSFDNDIALIKLDKPVIFNNYTSPLCLVQHADHVTDHILEDRECTITGYGIANKTNTFHEINVLHVAHVPLIEKKTCAGLPGYEDKVTDNMVCAGFDTGAVDTCKGDSGGPIQCKIRDKWYLVGSKHVLGATGIWRSSCHGVTSWGGRNYEGCAEPNEPGAYTDVSHYTEWIYTQIFNDYTTNTMNSRN